MKFTINDFGPIEHAEIETGDLTVIAGRNSTGKSHISCAIWYAQRAFIESLKVKKLYVLKDSLTEARQKISNRNIDKVNIEFPHKKITGSLKGLFGNAVHQYENGTITAELSFKANSLLDNLKVNIKKDEDGIQLLKRLDLINNAAQMQMHLNTIASSADWFSQAWMHKMINDFSVKNKNIMMDKTTEEILDRACVNALKSRFPDKHYILTTERTAALGYHHYLRDYMKAPQPDLQIIEPVYYNFIHLTRRIALNQGLPFRGRLNENSKIEEHFSEIMGGKFQLLNDAVVFHPARWRGSHREPLPFHLLSASQRCIAAIYYCLCSMVNPGDLLIIDEPESFLHPENQRRLARILAMAVNSGIKIIISTHSDYILNELSILYLMGHHKDNEKIQDIMERRSYAASEIIVEKTIRAYEMEEGKSAKGGFVPVPRDIDPEDGIVIPSIYDEIYSINRLEDAILRESSNG